MAARLEVRNACRRLGGVHALDDVNIALTGGEWVGLVGPNGAGKTTLMRALCGLEPLDRGEITWTEPGPGRRLARRNIQRIAIVPQDIALYALLTPRENLALFGRLNGLRRRRLRERVDWALDWTGLAGRADDPVRTLSGGMRRSLNIACSVLHRPDVLLLDEPTVGVDVAGRERIGSMLRSLRDDGIALLQSSHQLHEVQAACDRVLVMRAGRVLASLGPNGEGADGRKSSLRLTLDRDGSHLVLPGYVVRECQVAGRLGHVPTDLPLLLQQIEAQGLGVTEIRVEPPQLEDVLARLSRAESSA